MLDLRAAQLDVCQQFDAEFLPTDLHEIAGVAQEVGSGLLPINGLRHPPINGTSGWYVWAGESLSDAPDFFVPTHVDHLRERAREALPYLGLGPGWRFLLAPGHADVWFDGSLLDI